MLPAVVTARHLGGAARWMVAVAVIAVLGAACGDDPPDAAGSGPADGAQLYAANCAVCHGAELQGTTSGPSPLSQVYEPNHHSDEAFRAAILQGSPQHHWSFGAMAPIAGLNDDEIAAIIAFIREAQQREGFVPYPPPD